MTPPFLEKGAGWFLKNFGEIEKFRKRNAFWRRNALIIEVGQQIKLSEFLRNLAELGYSKVWEAQNRGEFSQRGGVIHIFPINSDKICAIEFEGNVLAEITPQPPLTLRREKDEIISKNANKFSPLKVRGQRSGGYEIGDYIVHLDHGIGVYRGITQTETQSDADFVIEYAPPKDRPRSPDLLFVPKTQVKKLSAYLGFKKPEIHRLGTPTWSLTRKKAKEDIVAFAKELLKTLAERKTAYRAPYESFSELEEELISNFPYEYTPDQKRALEEIFRDMSQKEPMDRILTGDVGFGKTEIAVVAAFRAVLNKKQAAVMAPTTILADQHYEVFKKRLSEFGVEIAKLTRLESRENIKKNFKKIEEGKADIIIGTHKILAKNLKWKDLGFLIIDEEQKFGVAHKEKLKKANPALDILTLSATPIPRTLQLALSGLRQISKIEIPPQGRMGIKTYVLPKHQKIIKGAISYEIERGGQVYFLANRIHKIPMLLEELKLLKIKMRIGILHGRMDERAIVRTMHDFREGKIDLLVSTTIIENGLDLSNVNTLIVEDATKLGLSQAHQLRGRIGRGDKEAFAYFLYPVRKSPLIDSSNQNVKAKNNFKKKKHVSKFSNVVNPTQRLRKKSADRLEALERYSWLGAGLELAKRDLEIRGAGNILGKAQSGVAYRIGLNLYFEFLEWAIAELRKT